MKDWCAVVRDAKGISGGRCAASLRSSADRSPARRSSQMPDRVAVRTNGARQSASRAGMQQCGASNRGARSLRTAPVTGLGRNVVQPFSPRS